MRKFSVLLVSFLIASFAVAQDNTIMSTYRILAKPGKDTELKNALKAHAAKFHKGDTRWKVFQVVSGPDEGCYQMNEGPTSWTALEARKDISDEHTRDYETTVLPLVEKTYPATYVHFEQDLSTDQISGTFKKVLLYHFYLKPGKIPQLRNELALFKKFHEKAGNKVVTWSSYFSGQPHFDCALRLTGGWSDLDKMGKGDMAKAFDEVAGKGAFERYNQVFYECVDHTVQEMLEVLPEIGSPEVTPK